MRTILVCLGFASSLPRLSPAQVTRKEALATAEEYLRFSWRPSAANRFHGLDQAGIQVDTPDATFARAGTRAGWWVPGEMNTGMPYQWGGFSSPQEFTTRLRAGAFAGDVYSLEKRKLGDAAVSSLAVGIDCSGLISRCWRLPRAYSTHDLPDLCQVLATFEELRPGDILNLRENHVLLFKAFADGSRERLLEYEAGSPPTWKVLLNSVPVSLLKEKGYQPLRYRLMKD